MTYNYNDAKEALQRLKPVPTTMREYKNLYKQDSRLKVDPEKEYKNKGWVNWYAFLGKKSPIETYCTYKEAQAAVKRLIPVPMSNKSYKKLCIQDPHLVLDPNKKYKNKGWVNWYEYLGKESPIVTYDTYEEAQAAVQRLNPIPTDNVEYCKLLRQDLRLVSKPNQKYKNKGWVNWYEFLGKESPIELYVTYEEAQAAVKRLKTVPTTHREYKNTYKQDPRLTLEPNKKYKNKGWINWFDFLGKELPIETYGTYEEAQTAVQRLTPVPTTNKEYIKLYKQDPRLVSKPNEKYQNIGWVNWYKFLRRETSFILYKSYDEAQAAVQRLTPVPTNLKDYKRCYTQDPHLPSTPQKKYQNKGWVTWLEFLGKQSPIEPYDTYEEAQAGVQRLTPVPSSNKEYKKACSQDPRLVIEPHEKYRNKGWVNWYKFLGKKDPTDAYKTYEEAVAAVQRLTPVPTTQKKYYQWYKQDPRLVSSPHSLYADKWGSYRSFLSLKEYNYQELITLVDNCGYKIRDKSSLFALAAKHRVSVDFYLLEGYYDHASLVGIEYECPLEAIALIQKILPSLVTYDEYIELRKLYRSLPLDPVSRYGFETFEQFLSFDKFKLFDKPQAQVFCNENKIETSKQYREFALKTPELPLKTNQIRYVSRLSDIYYKPSLFDVFNDNLHNDWIKLADEYCSKGLNATGREKVIKSFYTYYKGELNPSVETQCSTTSSMIDPTDWFNSLADSQRQKMTLNHLQRFFEYVLEQRCAHVSEEGEVVYLEGYRIPIQFKNLAVEFINNTLSESNKDALPFKYIQKAREYIACSSTKTIGDIYKNITQDVGFFNTFYEWFVVDESVIDKSDPNCIWKEEDGEYKIWSPVRIVAALFQLYVPFRGSQIVWSDSGEADKYKLIKSERGYQWHDNELLADYRIPVKYHQGLLKPADFGQVNSQVHIHVNTNKTAKNSYTGYDVPYIDERVLPFIVQLREWQSKYNPISSPLKWVDAKLVKANQGEELKRYGYHGKSCFLFRNPCDGNQQSPISQQQISSTLAGILLLIEDYELPLTTTKGKTKSKAEITSLSNIKSHFTLHSMRVSLITAYIRDAKISPEIIQKLVGHSSLVMTIYYTKVTTEDIRDELYDAENKIIQNQTQRVEQMIRQRKMDELSSELINAEGQVNKYSVNNNAALNSIMDYGMCPNGRTLCDKGGELQQRKPERYGAVEHGYLGIENCLQCRFFLTGSAFLGGLQMLTNELSLECKASAVRMNELWQEIDVLENEQYYAKKSGQPFKKSVSLDLTTAHYQSEVTRFDGLTRDFIMAVRFSMNSIDLLNNKNISESGTSLITKQGKNQVSLSLSEESSYTQLDMVCQSSAYYQSARPETASLTRSQYIDLFAQKNGFAPSMFALTPRQQIQVGNQITNLLITRLGSYNKLSELMDKDSLITLADLGIEQTSKISQELKFLMSGNTTNSLNSSTNNNHVGVNNEQ